jgi:hypothetical protein
MNLPPVLIVQNLASDSRLQASRLSSDARLNVGKIDANYRADLSYGINCISSRPIPLDFCQYTTDTSSNTLATPLFRQVMCLRNDVHHGRVFLKHKARLEPNRITAAPPLMPFRHNAVLGRLLLFGDLPFLRGGHR